MIKRELREPVAKFDIIPDFHLKYIIILITILTEAVTSRQAASSSTATRDHLTLVEGQQRLPWPGQ